jgi:hypothetical protein
MSIMNIQLVDAAEVAFNEKALMLIAKAEIAK